MSMVFLVTALHVLLILLGVWLLGEVGIRLYLERPLQTSFYSSLPRAAVRQRQAEVGVRMATGFGWAHLGWIADPAVETYRIERKVGRSWEEAERVQFGSFLLREAGVYRVVAQPPKGAPERVLGEVTVEPRSGSAPLYIPRLDGPWQPLFRPQVYGYYINDHTLYQDAIGQWRLVGITDKSDGNFNAEKYFAVGMSDEFPTLKGMREAEPVADYGELAWAPHVIVDADHVYHMFWSPHRLHHAVSSDGIVWRDHRVVMPAPLHKFFRDPMVLQVAPGQWLLYATARGRYFSQIDVYQSFDLQSWQYIGTPLRSGWGSERNSPFASTESPFVIPYQGRYYLSITYNNDSPFWAGILVSFKVWPNRASYNDTLIFQSDNPYDFGVYRGQGRSPLRVHLARFAARSPTLLARLQAHAAEYIYHPQRGQWYVTTAGWPWVATLTSGEVAVAPLRWDPVL